ncbi:hypothetical protein GS876_24600 [Rhodococcus hoagii]|nr:hypothetical protein [Prescottella equi]
MPRTEAEEKKALADKLRVELGLDQVKQFGDQVAVIRALAGNKGIDMSDVTDEDLVTAIADVLAPAGSEEDRQEKLAAGIPSNCSCRNGVTCRSRRCSRNSRTPAA